MITIKIFERGRNKIQQSLEEAMALFTFLYELYNAQNNDCKDKAFDAYL